MTNLGNLIDRALNRVDETRLFRALASDRRGIWTPAQTRAQLARAQAAQRRALQSEDWLHYLTIRERNARRRLKTNEA